jgi:hypothetical protein
MRITDYAYISIFFYNKNIHIHLTSIFSAFMFDMLLFIVFVELNVTSLDYIFLFLFPFDFNLRGFMGIISNIIFFY